MPRPTSLFLNQEISQLINSLKKRPLAGQRPAEYFRVNIMVETFEKIKGEKAHEEIQLRAKENLKEWAKKRAARLKREEEKAETGKAMTIKVHPDDWGCVTKRLTEQHGKIFAVLNMANAESVGGNFIGGAGAQEENIFFRTDAMLYGSSEDDALVEKKNGRIKIKYKPEQTDLINGTGKDGRVYLDTKNARVCFRGSEKRDNNGVVVGGYDFLADNEIFPFYEMRAAAQNCAESAWNEALAKKKIKAQFDTLKAEGIRHVVLSAFGCGEFKNPSCCIAELYREELAQRKGDFDEVHFAIYDPPGSPTKNFEVFNIVIENGRTAFINKIMDVLQLKQNGQQQGQDSNNKQLTPQNVIKLYDDAPPLWEQAASAVIVNLKRKISPESEFPKETKESSPDGSKSEDKDEKKSESKGSSTSDKTEDGQANKKCDLWERVVRWIFALKTASDKSEKNKILRAKFKGIEDLDELNRLFILFKDIPDLNCHKNPMRDRFFGIQNTATWRETLHQIREHAYQQLVEIVDPQKQGQVAASATDLLNKAKDMPIFKDHINNFVLCGAFGNTNTVNKIIALQYKIKNDNNNKP